MFYIIFKDMGICESDEGVRKSDLGNIQTMAGFKKPLTVATLNFCGIMNSPFEFYCQQYETELKEISNIFLSLIPIYIPNFPKEKKFRWEMGKIDLKVRVGRYSPMFQLDVGIEQGRFLNKAEFDKKWDEVFQKQVKKVQIQYKSAERQTTRLYDFIMYHTLLKYVYKVDIFQQAIKNNPQKYIDTLKPFYELSFLDETRKVNKMAENLSKMEADVFFFQEYSEFFYKYLLKRNEHLVCVDKTKDTLIIAKKSSFRQIKQIDFNKLSKEQKDNLGWADRSAFICLDNILLISAHLSSKAEKNKPQVQQLIKSLKDFKTVFPEYQIILGGDLNSYVKGVPEGYFMYPDSEKLLTTVKKRTYTQGQFHKAEEKVSESKDKIISTMKIKQPAIKYINGGQTNTESLVPTNEHPFDHFVLVVKVQRHART